MLQFVFDRESLTACAQLIAAVAKLIQETRRTVEAIASRTRKRTIEEASTKALEVEKPTPET